MLTKRRILIGLEWFQTGSSSIERSSGYSFQVIYLELGSVGYKTES